MKDQNADPNLSCDHCGGRLGPQLESSEQSKRLTYKCDGCGCQWVKGMILTHKGESCPVHGTAAQRTAISRATRLLAKAALAHL